MSSIRAAKSGFSRDAQEKLSAKYDPDLGSQCLTWIKNLVNTQHTAPDVNPELDFSTEGDANNVYKVLRDGIVLGRLINCLLPGSVPGSKLAHPATLAFKQMELIETFIRKAKEYGVPDYELFQTVDLYEEQNLHQVLICLQSLSRKAKAKGLPGFGPKEAEANRRTFTEEQLKAGEQVIGLQMGTNRGASQAGMTFGKHRMILD